MSEESYARGFCKAAASAGVSPVKLRDFMRKSAKGGVFDSLWSNPWDDIDSDMDKKLDKILPATATNPTQEDLSRATHASASYINPDDKAHMESMREAMDAMFPGLVYDPNKFWVLQFSGDRNMAGKVRTALRSSSPPVVIPPTVSRPPVPDISKLGPGARKLMMMQYANATNFYNAIERVNADRGLRPIRRTYAPGYGGK